MERSVEYGWNVRLNTDGEFGETSFVYLDAPDMASGVLKNFSSYDSDTKIEHFMTYDAVKGATIATTKISSIDLSDLSQVTAADHVVVDSDISLSANAEVDSLNISSRQNTALDSITISAAGGEVLKINSGHIKSGAYVDTEIQAKLDFGAANGQLYTVSNMLLSGGVTGTNGLSIKAGHWNNPTLEIAAAGQVTGDVELLRGITKLSADNALQGSDVKMYWGRLDIGSTTQNFNSIQALDSPTGYNYGGVLLANGGTVNTTGSMDFHVRNYDGEDIARINLNAGTDMNVSGWIEGDLTAAGNLNFGGELTGDATASNVEFLGSLLSGNITSDGLMVIETDHSYNRQAINGNLSGLADLETAELVLNGIDTRTGSTTIKESGLSYNPTKTLTVNASGAIRSTSAFHLEEGTKLIVNSDGSTTNQLSGGAINMAHLSEFSYTALAGSTASETVGRINVANGATGFISIDNADAAASAEVTAHSLNITNGTLMVDLGDNSSLFFTDAPIGNAANILDDVFITQSASDGSIAPSWAMYDSVDGLTSPTVQNANFSNQYGSGDYARLSNYQNLNADNSIEGLILDRNSRLGGNYTLNVGAGGFIFWEGAYATAIQVDHLDFADNEARIVATGDRNVTFDSDISGTAGLKKFGAGDLALNGNLDNLSGDLLIVDGNLEIGGVSTATDRNINLLNGTLSIAESGNLSATVTGSGSRGPAISNSGTFTNTGEARWNSLGNTDTGNFINDSGQQAGTMTVYTAANSGVFENKGNLVVERTFGNGSNKIDSNGGVFLNSGTATMLSSSEFTMYNNSRFLNTGSFVLEDNARITSPWSTNVSTIEFTNAGTMDISGDVYLYPHAGHDFVNNNGTVVVNDTGRIWADEYRQTGVNSNTVINGRVEVNTFVIDAGGFGGSGAIVGDVISGAEALIEFGNSPGAMYVDGDFTMNGSEMVMEVEGTDLGLFDQLLVGGEYDLTGDITFDLTNSLFDSDINGFLDTFSLSDFFFEGDLSNSVGISDEFIFDNILLYALTSTETRALLFADLFDGDALGVGFNASIIPEAGPSPVPVPAAVWLFGSGLIGLFGVARRKAA